MRGGRIAWQSVRHNTALGGGRSTSHQPTMDERHVTCRQGQAHRPLLALI